MWGAARPRLLPGRGAWRCEKETQSDPLELAEHPGLALTRGGEPRGQGPAFPGRAPAAQESRPSPTLASGLQGREMKRC